MSGVQGKFGLKANVSIQQNTKPLQGQIKHKVSFQFQVQKEKKRKKKNTTLTIPSPDYLSISLETISNSKNKMWECSRHLKTVSVS